MHIPDFITQRTTTFKLLRAIYLSVFLLSNFVWTTQPKALASQQTQTFTSVSLMSSSLSTISSSRSSINPSAETKVIATNQFSGDISRKEGDKLYITKDNTTKEYTLSPDVSIKKNTFNSSFDQLRVGDSVTIKESTSTGLILSVDAISKQVFDYSKWLIPTVLILILLGIITYYLFKKSNAGHIQTNNVTRS